MGTSQMPYCGGNSTRKGNLARASPTLTGTPLPVHGKLHVAKIPAIHQLSHMGKGRGKPVTYPIWEYIDEPEFVYVARAPIGTGQIGEDAR